MSRPTRNSDESAFFQVLGNRDLLKVITSFQRGKKWDEIDDAIWCARNGHLTLLKEKKNLKYQDCIFQTALVYNRVPVLEWEWNRTGGTDFPHTIVYQSEEVLLFCHSKGALFTPWQLDRAIIQGRLRKTLIITKILQQYNRDLLLACIQQEQEEAFAFLLSIRELVTETFLKYCDLRQLVQMLKRLHAKGILQIYNRLSFEEAMEKSVEEHMQNIKAHLKQPIRAYCNRFLIHPRSWESIVERIKNSIVL